MFRRDDGSWVMLYRGINAGRADAVTALTGVELTIGRGEENDIVLDGPMVSGQHARLLLEDRGATIEDLGSANGTTVNGVRVLGPRGEGSASLTAKRFTKVLINLLLNILFMLRNINIIVPAYVVEQHGHAIKTTCKHRFRRF